MYQVFGTVVKWLIPVAKWFLAFFALVRLCFMIATRRFYPSEDLTGKLVVINVENSELGIRAAQELSERGATVILGTMNFEQTKKRFESNTRVDVRKLDLYKLESVRSFARRILNEESRLDILINDFGVPDEAMKKSTVDGFDRIHQAIYLAPFLLTNILLALMKKSAPSRIINTGFLEYLRGSIETENLKAIIKGGGSGDRLSGANLAVVMWTVGMAAELKDSGVAVNLAHPGVGFTLHEAFKLNVGSLGARVVRFFCGSSATVGDYTVSYACLSPTGGSETGKLFFNCRPYQTFKGTDLKANKELIKRTRQLLKPSEY